MEEFQEFFSKIVLISSFEMDLAAITNKNVSLQIDAAYKIGRSIAVLLDEQVIGHLTRSASRSIWMQLKFGHRLEATVYGTLENGFQNKIQFSMLTKSLELGVCIRCFFHDCLQGECNRHLPTTLFLWVIRSSDSKSWTVRQNQDQFYSRVADFVK